MRVAFHKKVLETLAVEVLPVSLQAEETRVLWDVLLVASRWKMWPSSNLSPGAEHYRIFLLAQLA